MQGHGWGPQCELLGLGCWVWGLGCDLGAGSWMWGPWVGFQEWGPPRVLGVSVGSWVGSQVWGPWGGILGALQGAQWGVPQESWVQNPRYRVSGEGKWVQGPG